MDSLAKQIRLTGMAYPLFEIAGLVVSKPERFDVRYSTTKRADGSPVCPIFLCELDQTLFSSEDDAVRHVLRKHFETFYRAEKIPVDPPKGNYTFVAQCGLSGKILGPPNLHGYQEELRKLHAARYSRMPFDAFKAKVKIVRDEEVVQKWVEDQSFKTEFVCLNLPEELKLDSREAVEKHFRETHREAIVKQVDSHVLSSKAASEQPDRVMRELYRRTLTLQTKFPIKVVHELSQQFSSRGLQFFKVNKTVTHVAVSRPRHLDVETTPVNEGVKKIIEFIDATPDCNRRALMAGLAPRAETLAEVAGEATPDANSEGTAPAATAKEPEKADADGRIHLSPEEQKIHDDLHWLIHEGHVIEFAKGVLETAKAPKNPQARDAAAAYEVKRKKRPKKKPDASDKPAANLDEAVASGVVEPDSEAADATVKPEQAETPVETASEEAPTESVVAEASPAAGASEVESPEAAESTEVDSEAEDPGSNVAPEAETFGQAPAEAEAQVEPEAGDVAEQVESSEAGERSEPAASTVDAAEESKAPES